MSTARTRILVVNISMNTPCAELTPGAKKTLGKTGQCMEKVEDRRELTSMREDREKERE